MDSSFFFGISEVAYILAMIVYISYLAFKKLNIGRIATAITIGGFVFQTIAIAIRWKEFYDLSQMGIIRSAPLTNLYESLVFFVWCLILVYLIVEFKYKNRSFGAFVTPVAGLVLAFIDLSGMSKEIQPLLPALQSNWLLVHVLMSFIAYATFALSFSTGLMYLMSTSQRQEQKTGFWLTLLVFAILFALISNSPQTILLWILSFAFLIAVDIKLNIDITKKKLGGGSDISKTILSVGALSLVSIVAILIFIQLVKLQVIKADEAARLKHLGTTEGVSAFTGSVMGMVGLIFFLCVVLIKYLILHKEYYLFWSLTGGVFMALFLMMGIDFLKFRIGGVRPDAMIKNYLFKATILNPSPVMSIISYIALLAFLFTVWRYGDVFKKVISVFKILPETLDELTYKSITVGFPIFTLGGLIFGALWADQAWGIYWSWDPKETWSLITWFVYAFYLHARLLRGWRGHRISVVAVIGFIAVIFTYLGVNLLLSGLHAYGELQ